MGVLVDLFEEVRLRLDTEKASGGTITDINSITVSPKVIIRKDNDYPIINLWFAPGDESPYCLQRVMVDNMNIAVQLACSYLADDNNRLYNTTSSTGPLYLFEKVLNVLDKDISGNVNLTFDGKANNLRGYSYAVDHEESVIVFTITINVQSKQFVAGSR